MTHSTQHHRPIRFLLAGLACFAAALALSAWLSGCAAVARAAPTLLDVTERVLLAELDAARDDQQEHEINQALDLVVEARRAQRAAEEAAARAEAAAREAHDAAALARAHLDAAEARERSATLQRRLALALRAAVRTAPTRDD